MVDKKVWGLKSFLFAVATLFDTKGRPDGSAASVNYADKDGFKLVHKAHNWPSASGRIPEFGNGQFARSHSKTLKGGHATFRLASGWKRYRKAPAVWSIVTHYVIGKSTQHSQIVAIRPR